MASIRLTEKQIRYLRDRGGVHTLYAALERFLSGELVTEKNRFGRKSSETVTVLHSQADQAFHAVSGTRNPECSYQESGELRFANCEAWRRDRSDDSESGIYSGE